MRKRIKNRIIINNKNAIFAMSVFDSKKSFGPDTSDDEPKEEVNLEKQDGEDEEDPEEEDDEFEKKPSLSDGEDDDEKQDGKDIFFNYY